MRYIIFIFTIILLILIVKPAHAQQALDLSNVYDISDKDAKEGDILIFDPSKGIVRTSAPYDIRLFGVLQDQPISVFKRTDGTGKPVTRAGITKVNVTLSNGQIKTGDYITSSTLPGLGMKATLSGNIVGIALVNSTQNDKYDQKSCSLNPTSCPKDQISVAIKLEYAELTNPRSTNRLFEYIGTSFFKNAQDPQGFGRIIKNVVAGLVMLVCVIFGLLIVSRSISKTVEAIGRNPLAKRSILLVLAVNIAIVVFIIIGGIVTALIVLRL